VGYYLDIRTLPDPEFKETVLMNAIYTKFHKALCDLSTTSIGVSFPKFEVTLGNVLRIHGDELALNRLQNKHWVGGMSGYCQISDMKSVPADVKFRTVSRKQTTMSNAKLKRLQRRGSITGEVAKTYKAKMFTKGLDNPYIELVSGSNGHKHRRYIEFGELLDEPVPGEFDQFGLSRTATVPWFD
jgi:CRISPR-associated endonuclease Csy4